MSGVTNIGAFQGAPQIEKPQNRPAAGVAQPAANADFATELRSVTQPPVNAPPVNADAAAQGLNSLINTNLETEAAKVQALQVQQQLGSQTVGIVNQRASTILSLFNK
ncbi:MAG TPA: hypothetical protein VGB82_01230 [Alphaproteobacteria bacterium]